MQIVNRSHRSGAGSRFPIQPRVLAGRWPRARELALLAGFRVDPQSLLATGHRNLQVVVIEVLGHEHELRI